MPVGRGDGVNNVGVNWWNKWGFFQPAVPSTTPTHRHFVLSPVSLASRDQGGGLSNSTIDIYDLTESWGTRNSLQYSCCSIFIHCFYGYFLDYFLKS